MMDNPRAPARATGGSGLTGAGLAHPVSHAVIGGTVSQPPSSPPQSRPPLVDASLPLAPADAALRATRRVLADLFGPPAERPFAVRLWDGSIEGPASRTPYTLVVCRPGALRRVLLPPSEMSLVGGYLSGDLDVEGSLEAAATLGDVMAARLASPRTLARVLWHAALIQATDAAEEDGQERKRRGIRLLASKHSPRRDRMVVRFHYDVGNDFYALWLDRHLVYSCAYFEPGVQDLDVAQEAKLDYVCRKLRLRPGERLLDIGCGWGGLAMHAAERYGAHVLGITLSEAQAEFARARIAAAGLEERCRVEVLDYRACQGEARFEKIVSVGMVEHVGLERLSRYFGTAFRLLVPGGLFLNHGIVSIAAARAKRIRDRMAARLWRRNAFIHQYVFPDGDLVPIAAVIANAEGAGFELRDVESLREHYVATLREWTHRLERRRREAVALVGEETYRVWRLYMASSAHGFRSGRIGVIQTLLAKPDRKGRVALPRTRGDLYQPVTYPRVARATGGD
jgi:cyclopropane-fatty-acyl-phospholipid synthase